MPMDSADFELHGLVSSVPVAELEEDEPRCAICRAILTEAWLDDGDFYCEACMKELVEESACEAKAFAKKKCELTCKLPEYDTTREFKCTAEEYEAGAKESYTENSFRCHCRHHCTNYDQLIHELRRDDLGDRIYYRAIRARIDELLDDAGCSPVPYI
jgi:hypothetical protein